jgi:hypothetical protein
MFNPMFLIHLCALMQTGLMVFLILFPDDYAPKVKTRKIPFQIIKGIGLGGLIVFGIIFVDTAVLWLLGSWSMADWRFQLPSVVILLFLGLAYIITPLFKRGSIFDIVYCGVAITSILTFLHWWVPGDDVMSLRLEGGLPILLGILVGLYALIYLLKKQPSIGTPEKEISSLWDIKNQLDHIFNRTTYLIFWLLAVVQSMLAFFGFSILSLF